jgi:SAM-dependent methyltransferase
MTGAPDTHRGDVAAEWDQRYAKPGYTYGTVPNDFLASVAHRIPPGKVLSLGEGEGRNAVYLASLGHRVTAIDASSVGAEKTLRLAAERELSVETVVADLTSYEIASESWNGIISIFCHMPAPLRRQVHRAVTAGLIPGGVFVLEAYTPRQLEYGTGGPPVRDLLVTLSELRTDLHGLDLELAREVERDVQEGRCHQGRSAVVQILAVKREA